MTFYNVLSALLFVGVLRVLLLGFEESRWMDVCAAGCLIILVFGMGWLFQLSGNVMLADGGRIFVLIYLGVYMILLRPNLGNSKPVVA